MKDRTNKKFWDRVAFLYTIFMKNNNVVFEKISRIISEYLKEEMSVLELACGTGQLTFLLADKVSSWEATDFSKKMVEIAKKQSTGKNISFSVQDATNLPYSNNSFDVVLVANALHIMPNPEVALAEIYRVLKPDGFLFAPTFIHEDKTPKLKLFILEKIGFHTYHKWNEIGFSNFIKENKFNILEQSVIKNGLLSECMIVGKKSDK